MSSPCDADLFGTGLGEITKAVAPTESGTQSRPFKPHMDLSIICVNWNSLGYLRECIVSIYEYTHGISFEVIVVDNASSEVGVETLKDFFPNISIVQSSENLGFSRANNLGFAHSSGRYVLFLNPDTQLISPAINILLGSLQSLPDAGVLGAKLLNSDLTIQTSCIQKFPGILNQILEIEYLRLRWPECPLWGIAPLFSNDEKPIRVEVISGACMMLKREVFEQVGMFSDEYFMYADDLDLCYKVERAGWTNYYVGGAVVIHHGGKSTSQRTANQWATIMKFKSIIQFCTKTRGRAYGLLYRAAMGCAALGRLTILGLMYPLGSIVWNKETLQAASSKWSAVLKCAVGLQG